VKPDAGGGSGNETIWLVSAVPNCENSLSKPLLKWLEWVAPLASGVKLFTTNPLGPYSSVKMCESSVTRTDMLIGSCACAGYVTASSAITAPTTPRRIPAS
jgi:hypothetical protein